MPNPPPRLISVRYTCYCFNMLLFGNCIIVCHVFLELYSLHCNDLHCLLNNFGLKSGIDFENFGLKLPGYGYQGNVYDYKRIFLPSNWGE